MNQPKLFKYLLLGLPLGLLFLGAGSMIWHFKYPKETSKKPKNEAKSKPVARADLEFNLKRLSQELAARPSSDVQKTKQTASFIEGSLGINNIGFPIVTRVNFPFQGRELSNLSVEVKGSRSPEEIVLVVSHYDSAPSASGANANGSGVAANLSLANLFLRTTNQKTVQFHFLANGLGPAPTGAEVLAKKFRALGSNVVATLVLNELGGYGSAAALMKPAENQASTIPAGNDLIDVVWRGLEQQKPLVEHLLGKFNENSNVLSRSETLPALNSPTAQAFVSEGWPTVLISSGIPAMDDITQIDSSVFTETVRGLGRTLQAIANE